MSHPAYYICITKAIWNVVGQCLRCLFSTAEYIFSNGERLFRSGEQTFRNEEQSYKALQRYNENTCPPNIRIGILVRLEYCNVRRGQYPEYMVSHWAGALVSLLLISGTCPCDSLCRGRDTCVPSGIRAVFFVTLHF